MILVYGKNYGYLWWGEGGWGMRGTYLKISKTVSQQIDGCLWGLGGVPMYVYYVHTYVRTFLWKKFRSRPTYWPTYFDNMWTLWNWEICLFYQFLWLVSVRFLCFLNISCIQHHRKLRKTDISAYLDLDPWALNPHYPPIFTQKPLNTNPSHSYPH